MWKRELGTKAKRIVRSPVRECRSRQNARRAIVDAQKRKRGFTRCRLPGFQVPRKGAQVSGGQERAFVDGIGKSPANGSADLARESQEDWETK